MFVEQSGPNTAKVTWQAATDDVTPADQMGYEIHVSETANFTPSDATRRTQVFGVTEAEISGLETGKTYYVLVVAVDKQGERSGERQYVAINFSKPSTPQFPGISFSAPSDMDKATLAWEPAQDDTTPASAMKYEIHLSQQPDFEPDIRTLKSTVTGKTEQVITGLYPGTSYYVLVIAVDQDNNRSSKRQYHTLTTLTTPIKVNPTVTFHTDEEIGLGDVVQNGTQYTFSRFNSIKLPELGSVLFIHVGNNMHIRTVQRTVIINNKLMVETTDATLSDILDEATISTQVTLYESDNSLNGLSAKSTGSRSITSDSVKDFRSSGNILISQETSLDDLLDDLCEAETNGSIKAYTKISFEPTFDFNLSWKRDGFFVPKLIGGQAIARGALTAGIGFSIKGKAAIECSVEKTFLTRRSVQSYVVAGVPVFQVTTLTLKGKASIKTSLGLTSEASASAVGKAAIGVEFNPTKNSWEKMSESPTLEFKLDAAKAFPELEDTVSVELRLIPELAVRFYALAGPKVSVEPSVSATLGAVSTPPLARIGYPPAQMKTFDVAAKLEVNVGLSLGAFGKFAELDDAELFSKEWKLVSLPELSVNGGSGKVDDSIQISGRATAGVNNIFSEDTILWYVYPKDASVSTEKNETFYPDKESAYTISKAKFSSGKEGTYTVFFSGTGETTTAIPQFAWADVNVGKDEEPQQPTTPVTPPPTNEPCQDKDNPALEQWCMETEKKSGQNKICTVYAVDRSSDEARVRSRAEVNELANECNAIPNSCVHLKLNYAFACHSTLWCGHECDPYKVY